MEQQHGFSDSTQRAGGSSIQIQQLTKISKNMLSVLQLMSLVKSAPKSKLFPTLLIAKIRPIRGRLRNHSGHT